MPPMEMHDPVSVQVTAKSVSQSVEDFLHGSSKTASLFIDLTSTNVDGNDMQVNNENRNVFEDIPLFTGEYSDPVNGFQHFTFTVCAQCTHFKIFFPRIPREYWNICMLLKFRRAQINFDVMTKAKFAKHVESERGAVICSTENFV